MGEEITRLKNLASPDFTIYITEYSTGLVTTSTSRIVVRLSSLSFGEQAALLDFLGETGFLDVVILIGEVHLPINLCQKIKIFSSFNLMEQQCEFISMEAQRKQKKNHNFSIILADALFILNAIKKTSGISTKKLEVSPYSVQ